MSATSTAQINVPLTSYAQGFVGDRLAAYKLATTLCPIVRVGAAAGSFKKFDDRNSFLDIDTYRGIGGTRTRIHFEATDGSYNCKPHGLEVPVDDHEKALAAASNISNELLSQGKIKALLSRKARAFAKRAVAAFMAGVSAETDRGNWSNDSIDPIDQIDEQLDALTAIVESTENIKLVMSIGAFRKLRANAKAKARVTAIKTAIKPQDLVDTLLVPVELILTAASYTATKFGQTAASVSKSNILGDYAVVLYSLPDPSLFDPSAFKCFSTSDALVEAVQTYRDETAASDIHCVDWSEDIQQTSTKSARLLAIT